MLSVENIVSTFLLLLRSCIQLSTATEIEWLVAGRAAVSTGSVDFFLTTRIAGLFEFFICCDVGSTKLEEK
jgi:hypothetical protein